MINDSTTSEIKSDVIGSHHPRQSSLVFLRQFARVYMAVGSTKIYPMIIN